MARGFTDKNGKFRPTGRNSTSSRSKSLDPEITEKLKMQGRRMNKERRDSGFVLAGTKDFTVNLREPIPSPSQVSNIIDKSFNESRFASGQGKISIAEKEAFEKGFDRGIGITESIVTNLKDVPKGFHTEDIEELGFEFPPDEETVDSKDDLRSIIRQSAFDAESNDRQFSPFEFTAKEINDSMFDDEGEQINDAFDAFDEGIAQGVDFVLEQTEILEVTA